ncbi:PriCT-2 domain-containing protein [Hyphomicrobium sp.]|uniref:PriCT-2 domain-containing protein n=1 Tax=Hyphomicrobium sp. TaxID=82 RepID=UPI001DEF6D8B|nr:PriCT-2 domain-containing protein [Hyphomicrobium sp.]MBY0558808.1 PriCT-2 domain-containing protein [Hyphomicrobium sp.]
MNQKKERAPFTKEGKAPPEVLAQIRDCHTIPSLASLNARIGSLSYLASRSAKEFLPLRDVPLAGIVKNLCPGHLEQSDKDENALIWGDCKGARSNLNMQSMEALAFDCDGAISLSALKARLATSGHTALVYTTYSHGKISTKVSAERYQVFAAKHGLPFPPTREAMTRYLQANKLGHLQNILFDLSPENFAIHVAWGGHYVVLHDPLEKLRVILFLDKTMPLVGEGAVGIDGYKALYEKAAIELFGPEVLDIIDLSCRNPCQPIYLPAKPTGSTLDHEIIIFDGQLWSWQPAWQDVSKEIEARRLEIAARREKFADIPHDHKIRQLAECLKRIPADDYETWIRCLIVIFNETDGSDEGLRLAHDWSATVPDKYDEDALERKWESFGSPSNSASRVGLGTLVYLARMSDPKFYLGQDQSDFNLSLVGL